MWDKDSIFSEDLRSICGADFIPWEALRHRTLLVTGATGLIGSSLVKGLLYANQERDLELKILALVRSPERAREKFCGDPTDSLILVPGAVENLPAISGPIDYIVHGASQTASREFVDHPVETIHTSVWGTGGLLELARQRGVKSFVYLSSMEMYGYPAKGHKVTEEEVGALSPLDPRNSYPLSKQMCEALCCAYWKEYQTPARIIRLTQTFGPGVHHNDTRVFAYFARCVAEKRDIVLKTRGETERCYLYTSDAATAILTVLLKGQNGEAYNAADERTYCSIAEMAEEVAADGGVKVTYDLQDEAANGFTKTLYMDLDTTKLRALGWLPNRNSAMLRGGGDPSVDVSEDD